MGCGKKSVRFNDFDSSPWLLRAVPAEPGPPGCPDTLNEVPVIKIHFAAFAVERDLELQPASR